MLTASVARGVNPPDAKQGFVLLPVLKKKRRGITVELTRRRDFTLLSPDQS
jgi:hypothetical protein